MSPLDASRALRQATAALSLLLLSAWIALVLLIVGRPLATDDLWWHLAFGRAYAQDGPWLAGDPLLETPLGAPDPASWLFDLAIHEVTSLSGFQGLRLLHVVAVLAIAILVARLAWLHVRPNVPAAALATGVFLALSGYRLVQLRPELVTIGATLGLYALLLARQEPPSWGRIAAATVVMVLGANAHAGFVVGPILIGTGILGVLLRAGLEQRAGAAAARDASLARARRVGLALAIGLTASLLNPRGAAALLAPLRPFVDTRLPVVRDEWSSFDPLSIPASATRMSPLAWGVADALLICFVVAAVVWAWRTASVRSTAGTSHDEPVLFALGGASTVAMLLAIRLHWLALFPALPILAVAPSTGGRGSARRRLEEGSCALALGALLVAAPVCGGLAPARLGVPPTLSAYLDTPYAGERYHAEAVWFLADAGLSGHLFTNYYMGGFVGYWLAPRIRAFVNGTLNFPPERLLDDYDTVMRGREASGADPGHRDVLSRSGVDLFLGLGLPERRSPRLPARYTTPLLEDAPEWVTLFRNLTSAVYAHRGPAGRVNRERTAAYYAREGIAFDPERGFDAGWVLRERPDWAAAHGLVPVDYPAIEARTRDDDPRVRGAALDRLGDLYAALGLYEKGAEVERRILAKWPRARDAQRRLLFDLLHLGRVDEALRQGRAWQRTGVRDVWVEAYLSTASRATEGQPLPRLLPLFSRSETAEVLAGVPAVALRAQRP